MNAHGRAPSGKRLILVAALAAVIAPLSILPDTATSTSVRAKTRTLQAQVVYEHGNRPEKPGNCSAVVFVQWPHVANASSFTVHYTFNGAPQTLSTKPPFEDVYVWVKEYRALAGYDRVHIGQSWVDGFKTDTCERFEAKQRAVYGTQASVDVSGEGPALQMRMKALQVAPRGDDKPQTVVLATVTNVGDAPAEDVDFAEIPKIVRVPACRRLCAASLKLISGPNDSGRTLAPKQSLEAAYRYDNVGGEKMRVTTEATGKEVRARGSVIVDPPDAAYIVGTLDTVPAFKFPGRESALMSEADKREMLSGFRIRARGHKTLTDRVGGRFKYRIKVPAGALGRYQVEGLPADVDRRQFELDPGRRTVTLEAGETKTANFLVGYDCGAKPPGMSFVPRSGHYWSFDPIFGIEYQCRSRRVVLRANIVGAVVNRGGTYDGDFSTEDPPPADVHCRNRASFTWPPGDPPEVRRIDQTWWLATFPERINLSLDGDVFKQDAGFKLQRGGRFGGSARLKLALFHSPFAAETPYLDPFQAAGALTSTTTARATLTNATCPVTEEHPNLKYSRNRAPIDPSEG